ncbi:Type-2 angiotensin II receptor [Acipenser ruthenus]|uniref:Type-1 angiotensin II receptor n=1 Tax=Acipenser ruthenus TaxID=7906 RepID=A0A444V4F5_ACIRT|nr:Type-2 angiotensin II receptor [Acipenser ruthenus]
MTAMLNNSLPFTTEGTNFSSVNGSLNGTLPVPSCPSVSLSDYQSELIPAIYSIIFILGFIGNSVVVVVLCLQMGCKTVASTYILNLAISDLLFLTSLPLWAVYYAFGYNWIFGAVMCKICGSLLCINLYASIFFITCMSVDRYLAIVYPFRSQRRRSLCQAQSVTFLVWTLACLSTLPTMCFRNTYNIPELGVMACVMDFPNPRESWFVAMALMKNILGFLVPFTVIASCCIGIGKHLLGATGLDKNTPNRDRALRMVVAVMLAFFFCWCPFHIITFLDVLTRLNLIQSCGVKAMIDTAVPFTLCIAFANSTINPFLYCFVGIHFREQFRRLSERRLPHIFSKRGSTSTRLSSFSRKLSDVKEGTKGP